MSATMTFTYLPSTSVISFKGEKTSRAHYYQAVDATGRVVAHGIRDVDMLDDLAERQAARGRTLRHMAIPGVTDRARARAFMTALGSDATDYDPSVRWTLGGYRD